MNIEVLRWSWCLFWNPPLTCETSFTITFNLLLNKEAYDVLTIQVTSKSQIYTCTQAWNSRLPETHYSEQLKQVVPLAGTFSKCTLKFLVFFSFLLSCILISLNKSTPRHADKLLPLLTQWHGPKKRFYCIRIFLTESRGIHSNVSLMLI